MNSNDEQLDYWNNAGGARWVENQDALDRMVRPFGEAALARLEPRAGEHALDVGCGCGETLLSLAQAVGPSGTVTGIDPSRPMLARARARIATAALLEGDASVHPFARRFDVVFSRFGVMFFSDPVGAFAHLVAALAPNGRLGFVCWRSQAENPWGRVPVDTVRAALPHLPPLAPIDPRAPGPFSLAVPEHITEVLRAAGLSQISIEPVDAELCLSRTSAADAANFVLVTGPTSRLLADATAEERAVAVAAIAEALAPHTSASGVSLPGAAWTVLARA